MTSRWRLRFGAQRSLCVPARRFTASWRRRTRLQLEESPANLSTEILLNSQEEAVKLLGKNGELRRRIQQDTPVRIVDRGAKVVVIGNEPEASMVGSVLDEMLVAVRNGHTPSLADVNYALTEARNRQVADLGKILTEVPLGLRRDMQVKPRTRGQKRYLDAMRTHDVTIAIGPAGTGKTYLAMAAAVSALLNKEVNRLVLTRPAVEAGENLGFLPGDLYQKVHPYLRPLYDALYSMLDAERVRRLMEREQIEVAPLAFMRGRTLEQVFAILDEAQNTTPEQMKMFLTRLGVGTRAVVTGDVTQIDLPKGIKSGLVEAQRILRGTKGISIVHLSSADVVRHPLVQGIIDAYEADTEARTATPPARIPDIGNPV
ncbi:MAG: PhoH family protein [Candidatus Hydrogenedentes bacterium]|nr:PhoH family protein [Candidatus Hydrogenedentota bacterium]